MLQATLCLGKNISDHSQCSSQGINHQIGWNISNLQLNINAGKCKMKKEKKGKRQKENKKVFIYRNNNKNYSNKYCEQGRFNWTLLW